MSVLMARCRARAIDLCNCVTCWVFCGTILSFEFRIRIRDSASGFDHDVPQRTLICKLESPPRVECSSRPIRREIRNSNFRTIFSSANLKRFLHGINCNAKQFTKQFAIALRRSRSRIKSSTTTTNDRDSAITGSRSRASARHASASTAPSHNSTSEYREANHDPDDVDVDVEAVAVAVDGVVALAVVAVSVCV